jgi:hypothetical protein
VGNIFVIKRKRKKKIVWKRIEEKKRSIIEK